MTEHILHPPLTPSLSRESVVLTSPQLFNPLRPKNEQHVNLRLSVTFVRRSYTQCLIITRRRWAEIGGRQFRVPDTPLEALRQGVSRLLCSLPPIRKTKVPIWFLNLQLLRSPITFPCTWKISVKATVGDCRPPHALSEDVNLEDDNGNYLPTRLRTNNTQAYAVPMLWSVANELTTIFAPWSRRMPVTTQYSKECSLKDSVAIWIQILKDFLPAWVSVCCLCFKHVVVST